MTYDPISEAAAFLSQGLREAVELTDRDAVIEVENSLDPEKKLTDNILRLTNGSKVKLTDYLNAYSKYVLDFENHFFIDHGLLIDENNGDTVMINVLAGKNTVKDLISAIKVHNDRKKNFSIEVQKTAKIPDGFTVSYTIDGKSQVHLEFTHSELRDLVHELAKVGIR
jgi:hypothetical protein